MAIPRLDSAQLFAAGGAVAQAVAGTANGTSNSFVLPVNQACSVFVTGAFGAGNVTIEMTPDGGTTWVQVGAAITVAGVTFIAQCAQGVRAKINGATSPALSVWVVFADNTG